jgi:hypothetical protein
MHREVMGDVPDGFEVDHVNGNKVDNRRANLRLATRSQNNRNKPLQGNNTSGFRGVAYHKPSGFWVARVFVNKRQTSLGCYRTAEEAAHAYDAAAREHYGTFARLNFPDN